MKEFNNLQESAQNLTEKYNYLRKDLNAWMEKWAEITKGLEFKFYVLETEKYGRTYDDRKINFYIQCGRDDLYYICSGVVCDFNDSYHFSEKLKIEDIKSIILQLKNILGYLAEKIDSDNETVEKLTNFLRNGIN